MKQIKVNALISFSCTIACVLLKLSLELMPLTRSIKARLVLFGFYPLAAVALAFSVLTMIEFVRQKKADVFYMLLCLPPWIFLVYMAVIVF